MDPIFLQKQLRENSNDLDTFYKELKTWGDEMKRKEQPTTDEPALKTNDSHNKKKKHNIKNVTFNNQNTEIPKIGATDYSAWDKFDADAECEKVDYDENDDSDLTDECDDKARDDAYVEKELGNKFVKRQKWDEAISAYSKAISLYSLDPIFYANRALCFIKKLNYSVAESDCSMALKLDNTYVKAYHRRATARDALNKFQEAEQDLLKVLELEPNNVESSKLLEIIRKKLTTQRPVSKFTASRSNVKKMQNVEVIQKNLQKQITDSSKPLSYWPSGEEDIINVKTINKPVHLRSKKPLKRIEIQDIETVQQQPEAAVKTKVIERRDPGETKNIPATAVLNQLKTDDLKVIERKKPESLKETKNIANETVALSELVAPKTSVQFYEKWRQLEHLKDKYCYLKLIKPEDIKDIFKESMDSNVFSSILQVLAEYFTKYQIGVFDFLLKLTEIKRFSTFTIFLTDNDKKCLWKLFDHVKQFENKSKEDVDLLIQKYEL